VYIFSGTTNRKELIDEALLRPGRLEVHVEIGLPDKRGRFDILNIHTAQMRNKNLADTPDSTDGFSGAAIEGIVKTVRKGFENVLLEFKQAMV